MDALYLVGIAVLAVFGFVFAIILFNFFGIWLRARIANAPVGMGKMIGMRLRRVPVGLIVDNRITAVKAGIEVPSDPLEAHYLAGGDVTQVILALIAADKAGISLDFNRACAIDLATKGTGKTVLEAVRTSINPKVIDAPSPNMGRSTIDGVAQDGIGVKVKARVTLRSHLDRLGENLQGCSGKSGSHFKPRAGQRARQRVCIRHLVDRYSRRPCRRQHRRETSDRASRSRQACRASQSGSASRRGGRSGTGDARQDAGDAGQSC